MIAIEPTIPAVSCCFLCTPVRYTALQPPLRYCTSLSYFSVKRGGFFQHFFYKTPVSSLLKHPIKIENNITWVLSRDFMLSGSLWTTGWRDAANPFLKTFTKLSPHDHLPRTLCNEKENGAGSQGISNISRGQGGGRWGQSFSLRALYHKFHELFLFLFLFLAN